MKMYLKGVKFEMGTFAIIIVIYNKIQGHVYRIILKKGFRSQLFYLERTIKTWLVYALHARRCSKTSKIQINIKLQ